MRSYLSAASLMSNLGRIACRLLCATALLLGGQSASAAPNDQFLLVSRDFQVAPVRIAALNDQSLVHMDEQRGWVTIPLAQCVALIAVDDEEEHDASSRGRPARGAIALADGQRLPGEAATSAPAPLPEHLAWDHPWLGRINVPLKMIESIAFRGDAQPPAAAQTDVVLLANGDRQNGFVTAIGDSITMEVEVAGAAPSPAATTSIPLDRVNAVTLVTPRRAGAGRRVWFREGTVLDVQSIVIADDGSTRFTGSTLTTAEPPSRIGVDDVAAILLERGALTALASIVPARVEGPSTRYVIPRPAILDSHAPLGLSAIEYSGPLIVRYTLPAGCDRLIAQAELPADCRAWGDCEIIVRSGNKEVFRARLHSDSPLAELNFPLVDRELTIELAEGGRGPVQDRVHLNRAMLLKSR